MFQTAYAQAAGFTRPVVQAVRTFNGEVVAGAAAFIVLNADGWAITAAHVFDHQRLMVQHQSDVDAHNASVAKITENKVVNETIKRSQLAKQEKKANGKWVTGAALWWSDNGVTAASNLLYPSVDVALVRLGNHQALGVTTYPTFKEPTSLRPGTSLIKMGFPFTDVNATFDEATGAFDLGQVPPLPLFPMEGILTRFPTDPPVDGIPKQFVETSSPGLLGQSGGPTLDSDGVVCAMQVRTIPLSLGFSLEVPDGKKNVTEHQVLNVGWGVHTSALREIFDRNGVVVQWAA